MNISFIDILSKIKPKKKNIDYSTASHYVKEKLSKDVDNKVKCIYSGLESSNFYKNYFYNIEHVVPESMFRRFDEDTQIKIDYHITYPCILPINFLRQNYVLSNIPESEANVLVYISENDFGKCSKHKECEKASNYIIIKNKTDATFRSIGQQFTNYNDMCISNRCPSSKKFSLINLDSKEDIDSIEPVIKIKTKVCNYDRFGNRNPFNKCLFEPIDSNKGIIARAIFYFYVTYYNISGIRRNINSLLKDCSSSKYDSDCKNLIDLLLKWNEEHPITKSELKRNNIIFNKQYNYNIFVGIYNQKQELCPKIFARFLFNPSSLDLKDRENLKILESYLKSLSTISKIDLLNTFYKKYDIEPPKKLPKKPKTVSKKSSKNNRKIMTTKKNNKKLNTPKINIPIIEPEKIPIFSRKRKKPKKKTIQKPVITSENVKKVVPKRENIFKNKYVMNHIENIDRLTDSRNNLGDPFWTAKCRLEYEKKGVCKDPCILEEDKGYFFSDKLCKPKKDLVEKHKKNLFNSI